MARSVFISFESGDRGKAHGFNLLRWAKNLDVDFRGRHLLKAVKSDDSGYVSQRIKEQLSGTSVTVVLIGKDTAKSDWVSKEVQWSLEKSNPNGIVGIVVDPGASIPEGLTDCGAEILNWRSPKDVAEFGPAIERAACAAGRVPALATTATTSCVR